MGAERHDGLAIPGLVVLAHEQPFVIGSLHVDPPRRQVSANGRSETVEPRVMQVLVALRRANGAIVTRDELTELCWGGRVVGDDSINRALSRIRRIATGIGGGSFTVETIARVGYRLASKSPGDERTQPPAARSLIARRPLLLGFGAAGVVAAAGAGVWLARPAGADPIPTEARQLYERAVAMQSTADPAAMSLTIPYLQEAVRLAPRFGEAWGLLAVQYRGEMLDNPARAGEYAPRLDEALANADRYAPGNADADAARLIRQDQFRNWHSMELVYRQLASRHPDYALAHNMLGYLLMDVGRWNDAIAPLRRARALQPLDPGGSYKLIVALWSAGRLSAAEDEIETALRRWPKHGAIWQTKIKVLTLTGRPRAALQLLDDPDSHPPEGHSEFIDHMRLVAMALITGTASDRAKVLTRARRDQLQVGHALYCAAIGEVSQSLDMLETIYLAPGASAATGHARRSTHPLFQPHARPLWSEPRFESLLVRVGLEDYWQKTGSSPDYRR